MIQIFVRFSSEVLMKKKDERYERAKTEVEELKELYEHLTFNNLHWCEYNACHY